MWLWRQYRGPEAGNWAWHGVIWYQSSWAIFLPWKVVRSLLNFSCFIALRLTYSLTPLNQWRWFCSRPGGSNPPPYLVLSMIRDPLTISWPYRATVAYPASSSQQVGTHQVHNGVASNFTRCQGPRQMVRSEASHRRVPWTEISTLYLVARWLMRPRIEDDAGAGGDWCMTDWRASSLIRGWLAHFRKDLV